MGENMRFFAAIGMCLAANLVTRDCSACPFRRRGALTEASEAASETSPKLACCTGTSLSTCGTPCNNCAPAHGCFVMRRRGVMSDDFDDLEQDISLNERADFCNP